MTTFPAPPRAFADRHIGPTPETIAEMLQILGLDSLETLVDKEFACGIRL